MLPRKPPLLKKMHHIAKKAHLQMFPSCMFCTRNNLKNLSSDDEGQTPTAACMHHVILFVFTEAQHGGTQCGCGKGESKAENKGYILTSARYYHICPHAVQTRSTLHQLITTCCVKAQLLVTTPGSQRHPQIFCNIGGDLNRGVTFSLVLSLIVFCGCLA